MVKNGDGVHHNRLMLMTPTGDINLVGVFDLLSLGVESGDVILAVAVLSILITAPLGAIGIKLSAPRLLDGSST
jgi:hypothetical protein